MSKKVLQTSISDNLQLEKPQKKLVVSSLSELTTFPERLQKILGSESARSFALRADILPATFHNYVKGTSEPKRPEIIAIAKAANVNVQWLATGQGPMTCEKPAYHKALNSFNERLFVATTGIGLGNKKSKKEIAEVLGLHANQLDAFLTGEEEPAYNQMQEIARITGVRLQWLVDGIEPMREEDRHALAEKASFTITNLEGRQVEFKPSPSLCHLPILDLRASCGSGSIIDSEAVQAVFSATASWIRRELGANPEDLSLVFADGDSMADTIKPEEIVIVDRSKAKRPGDGIWVFLYDNGLFIKRLQFMPGKQVEVTSDNPRYKTYSLTPDDSFRLLGRVIAALPLRRL